MLSCDTIKVDGKVAVYEFKYGSPYYKEFLACQTTSHPFGKKQANSGTQRC